MSSYNDKDNEKYVEYDVRCVLKLLTTTSRVRYFRLEPKTSSEYTFSFSKKNIKSRIKQD